jgi:UDP-N-acetyl-D-mannosaminuronic acid transferase (WecB/TagA/CpsF family)
MDRRPFLRDPHAVELDPAEKNIPIYLYGLTRDTIRRLRENLAERVPGLSVVGCEPPVFRPLTPDEDCALVERINRSGASFVFPGVPTSRDLHTNTIRRYEQFSDASAQLSISFLGYNPIRLASMPRTLR